MGVLSTIRYLPKFIEVVTKGEFTGDAVILKSTFGKFEPSVNIKDFIEERKHIVPDFSDVDFSSFAKGSFGESYYQFMKAHGLKPFRFSGRYTDLMEKNYLPVFYASVHDFIHVLTGYDTSFAGEAGVWAFISAQNISPQAYRANKIAQILFPIAKPSQRKLIRRAGVEGSLMGLASNPLLKMDFRNEFGRPLDELRASYKIKPTSIHEIRSIQKNNGL